MAIGARLLLLLLPLVGRRNDGTDVDREDAEEFIGREAKSTTSLAIIFSKTILFLPCYQLAN